MLSIKSATEVFEKKGIAKAAISDNDLKRHFVLSVMAGAYIAIGGVLSLIAGYGFPEITAANPSLQRILSGFAFPIGLILVVMLGAELFTGNNALLIPGMLNRRVKATSVLRNWILVYIGNFVGALAFTSIFVYACGLTSTEPYNTAIQNIAIAKTSMPWLSVFIKGIGANWFVCLAVMLSVISESFTGKALGCWLPVMAFVVLGYEHSIANMFFIPAGMLEGAPVSVSQFIINNLVPATLGNIIGGALFVGTAFWYTTKND